MMGVVSPPKMRSPPIPTLHPADRRQHWAPARRLPRLWSLAVLVYLTSDQHMQHLKESLICCAGRLQSPPA